MNNEGIKNNPNVLLDNFIAYGHDYEGFRKGVAEMEGITNFEKFQCVDLCPVTVIGQTDDSIVGIALNPEENFLETLLAPFGELAIQKVSPAAKKNAEMASEVALCNDFLKYFGKRVRSVAKEQFYKRGDFTDVLEEVNSTKMLLSIDESYGLSLADDDAVPVYLVSKLIDSDLVLINIKGDFAFSPTLVRNAAIAQQLNSKKEITVISRNIEGVKKIFAIRSGSYAPIPQSVLCDVVDDITRDGKMGKVDVHGWEITHPRTSINIEFPEQDFGSMYGLSDALIPGIYLETSDTGDCSITAYETWRVRNSVSFRNKVSRVHSGHVSRKEIFDDITSNIFSDYAKLPEALCSLMSIDIAPDADLTTPAGCEENRTEINALIKSLFKQMDAVRCLGKKNEKNIKLAMEAEWDYSRHYTAYDVAISIMTLPERIHGAKKATAESLQKMISKAPFMDYEKYKEEKEEENIVLC